MFAGLLHARGFRGSTWRSHAGGGIRMRSLSGAGGGELPPLIIACGLGSTSNDYVLLLFKLFKLFKRVTIIDPPGVGDNAAVVTAHTASCAMASALDALLAAEPSVLLGHSLGGRFALDYATRRSGAYAPPSAAAAAAASSSATAALDAPLLTAAAVSGFAAAPCREVDRLLALVLVCSMGAPFAAGDLALMADVYSARTWASAAAIVRGATGGRTDIIQTGATWARLRKPAAQALIHSALFSTHVPEAAVCSLRVPTLLAWGSRDALVPGGQLRWFAGALPPHAVVKLLPQLSHQNFALGHGPAVRQVVRFVKRVAAAAAAEAAAALAAGTPLAATAAPPIEAVARRLSELPESAAEQREDAADRVQGFAA